MNENIQFITNGCIRTIAQMQLLTILNKTSENKNASKNLEAFLFYSINRVIFPMTYALGAAAAAFTNSFFIFLGVLVFGVVAVASLVAFPIVILIILNLAFYIITNCCKIH